MPISAEETAEVAQHPECEIDAEIEVDDVQLIAERVTGTRDGERLGILLDRRS